jgi:hypothetical protein
LLAAAVVEVDTAAVVELAVLENTKVQLIVIQLLH